MKRSHGLLTSIVACSFTLMACGPMPAEHELSQARIDIDVPLEDIEGEIVKDLIEQLADLSLRGGKTQVSLDEIASMFPVPDDFAQYVDLVLDGRNEIVDVECRELRCVASSTGRRTQFRVDDVNIPILGSPTIIIEPTVRINYRFNEELTVLEACRISGIRARTGLITQNVDGAFVAVDDNGDPAKIFVDVGVSGSYPSQDCDF